MPQPQGLGQAREQQRLGRSVGADQQERVFRRQRRQQDRLKPIPPHDAESARSTWNTPHVL